MAGKVVVILAIRFKYIQEEKGTHHSNKALPQTLSPCALHRRPLCSRSNVVALLAYTSLLVLTPRHGPLCSGGNVVVLSVYTSLEVLTPRRGSLASGWSRRHTSSLPSWLMRLELLNTLGTYISELYLYIVIRLQLPH